MTDKMYKKNLLIIGALFIVLLFTMAHVSKSGRHIYRTKDGKTTSFEEMIEDIKSAQVVFVGEQHDNPDHHNARFRCNILYAAVREASGRHPRRIVE